jgi:ABC-type multidrug transport system fused ATPase/permease subunit
MFIPNPLQEVRTCLNILSSADRRKYILVLVLQAFLGLLDLIGVAILGIVGSLALRGIQSSPTGDRVTKIISFLNLSNYSVQGQVAILGSIAVVALVGKTIASVYFSRKILFFLSMKTAEISSELISLVFLNPKLGIQSSGSQEIQYAVGPGVSAISIGVLGAASTLISDFSLLILLSIGLFIYDPLTAISVMVIFLSVGTILYFAMFSQSRKNSERIVQFNIESNKTLQESIQTYREIYVGDRREFYIQKMSELKHEIASSLARQAFMPNVSKYAVEITLILGSISISAILFATQDASHAVAGLALFLASGSRIGPSLLRLQQSMIQIHSSYTEASPAISIIKQIKSQAPEKIESGLPKPHPNEFVASIVIQNLNFEYPETESFSLNDVSLKIETGSFVALVGPSGSGKSTLIDLILGIQEPTSGEITVSNILPAVAIKEWPGKIAYVPQDVRIIDSSIKNNIALGIQDESIELNNVSEALRTVQLEDFVNSLPEGVETRVGEFGSRLSGGQRQRLGIARALYTKPSLLVMDEATSALDGQTEAEVSAAIKGLKRKVTLVVVAHRLSTVRDADQVVYIDKGLIKAVGTFDQVREQVPDFAVQADLMGLD